MENIPFDWKKIRSVLVAVAAILGLLLGVVNYVAGQLPGGTQALGATNFDTIQVGDGSVSEPAFGFTSDPDNGLYRIGTNNIGLSAGGTKVLDATASGVSIVGTFAPSGVLNANGGIAVDTSAFTVADTSGNVNTAGTLAIGGVTFTGAVKYGTAASYTSGAAITHGFATTPTVCLLQPVRDVTSTLTIGATTFSSDMADVAEAIYWVCGK